MHSHTMNSWVSQAELQLTAPIWAEPFSTAVLAELLVVALAIAAHYVQSRQQTESTDLDRALPWATN